MLMFNKLGEDKSSPFNYLTEKEMINTSPSIAVDEPTTEEQNTTRHFFSRDTSKKSPADFTPPSHENDDITPFYVLGYN